MKALRFIIGATLLAWLGITQPALAQGPPGPPATGVLAGQVILSVSGSSSRVALPSAATSAGAITIYNSGSADGYFAMGSVTIVATTGGTCVAGVNGPSCIVPTGTYITVWNTNGAGYIAGISGSTTTFVIYQGTGPLQFGKVGGSGGGGSGITLLTAGTNITLSSGATCTSSCTINSTGTGVTSITGGNGILPSTNPCIATCTLNTTVTNNAQTGTTYALQATDGGKVVSASNSSSEAYSIAAATTTGLTAGFGTELDNIGAGITTLTATTSLFDNGTTSLALAKGQDAYIWSDSANYHSVLSLPTMAADTLLGNLTGTAGQYPVAAAIPSCANDGTHALVYASHALACASISGGGGVSSITGTANQITASASTGAVTLSLPANVQTTTLALGGATIGSDNLGVTGSATVSGAVTGASFSPTSATVPTLGIYQSAAGTLGVGIAGVRAWSFNAGGLSSNNSSGAQLINGTASATVMTVLPNRSGSCGLGAASLSTVSFICNSVEMSRLTATALVMETGQFVDKGYTVSTLPTGIQGGHAFVTDQLTTCAVPGAALTGGGSITCPAFFNGSAWVGG